MIIKRYTVGGWRNVVIGTATLKTAGTLLDIGMHRFNVEGAGALASITLTVEQLRSMLAAAEAYENSVRLSRAIESLRGPAQVWGPHSVLSV